MANNILEMALERLERDFPPSSLSAWFDDATVVSFTDNRLILHSPVEFKKEFIDHKFIEPLQNALYELTGDQIDQAATAAGQCKGTVPPPQQHSVGRTVAAAVLAMMLVSALRQESPPRYDGAMFVRLEAGCSRA